MKLIHECVRDIMLDLEENLTLNGSIDSNKLESRLSSYSHSDIYYNCQKLKKAGYIKVEFFLDSSYCVTNITYNGHLFLDTIRDDGIWKKIKSKTSKLASVSLPILQQVGTELILAELGH